MYSILFFLFSLKVSLCSCRTENHRSGFRSGRAQYTITRVGRLPAAIRESSGLVYRPDRRTFWTHNDSGGKPTLYEITAEGQLTDSLPLSGLVNRDWEALTVHRAPEGPVLYIGDIGNNGNSRRDLTIYRVPIQQPAGHTALRLAYADQGSFPATKDTRNFDSEALVFARDSLHLFSKNRSRPRRLVRRYTLPDQPGAYTLQPVDSVFLKSMVTDAALSPDGRTLALLTYGKVFLFNTENGAVSLRRPRHCVRLPRGQTEAIAFVNNTDWVMTNERGWMFRVERKVTK